MQGQRIRSLEERLNNMQESIAEQLNILKALALSQALAVEQQDQTFFAQMNADSLLRKVNVNVNTVIKTTDSILGISKRTEALVKAVARRDYSTIGSLLLDPWFCLYAYMLLHPLAPSLLEAAASVWQFILFAYRLRYLITDIKQSSGHLTTLGGIVTLYLTSPYKALYYLYWLNRAFVYGEIQATQTLVFDLSLPLPACSLELAPKNLVCAAEFLVNSTAILLQKLKITLKNSDVATQISTLIRLEWVIWYSILYAIYSLITQGLYSMLPSRVKYFF